MADDLSKILAELGEIVREEPKKEEPDITDKDKHDAENSFEGTPEEQTPETGPGDKENAGGGVDARRKASPVTPEVDTRATVTTAGDISLSMTNDGVTADLPDGRSWGISVGETQIEVKYLEAGVRVGRFVIPRQPSAEVCLSLGGSEVFVSDTEIGVKKRGLSRK